MVLLTSVLLRDFTKGLGSRKGVYIYADYEYSTLMIRDEIRIMVETEDVSCGWGWRAGERKGTGQ